MTNPWDGPRHRSWASNTMLTFALLIALIIATVATDYFGEPPNYLVGLLGTAAGAFFTAIGSDRNKRDAEVSATAHRAEAKAEAVERRVESGETRADVSETRADAAEQREGEWRGQHRDHQDEDGGGRV